MAVIWYAIGIYMIGIAVVLYLRPRTMFREDGMWKEFGLNTDTESQTIFPFWMFSLVWAILSYALGNLLCIFFASVTMRAAETKPLPAPNASFIQPISIHPNMNVATTATATAPAPPTIPTFPTQFMTPPSVSASPAMPQVPGYYILDPYSQTPRYLYYGSAPPGFIQGMEVGK